MTANIVSPSPLTPANQSHGGGGAGGANARFTPLDPIKVVQQNKVTLILVFVLALILGILLYVFLLKTSPEYTSEAQLLVTGSLTEPYEQPSMSGELKEERLDVLGAFIKNQINLIKSDDVLRVAMDSDAVKNTRWYNQWGDSLIDAREDLHRRIGASQIIGSTLIRLSIKGEDAADLQPILDTVIAVYLDQFRQRTRVETSEVRSVFREEADRAEDEYLNLQNRLKQFREEHDLATLEEKNDEATIAYTDLAARASALAVALQTSREQYRALSDAMKEGRILEPSADELAQVEADPAVSLRDERLRSLREQREIALHRLGEKHRVILNIDYTIEATEGERAQEVARLLKERQEVMLDQARKQTAQFEAQIAGLQPALEESRARVRDFTEELQEYNAIEYQARQAAARRAKAEELLRDMDLSGRRPDNAGVRAQVAATTPKLTFPTVGGVVASTVILLEVLALGLIFLKELLDQRIKSPTDVTLLPNANVLGVIPHTSEDKVGPTTVENIVQRDPTGLMSESFRQARTSILAAAERKGHRVIMAVGPQPGSGVSSMVNNLALSMAFDGRKVLVIDANFRRPAMHRMFGVGSGAGLAEVLDGSTTFDQAVVHYGDPNVDVLTAGNTASAAPELLEGRAFQNLLNDCRNWYDIVLIDTPPVLLTSEATMLSKQVDAVFAVVRAQRDQRGMVARMVRQVASSDAEMLGILLNGVRAAAGGYFAKNYSAFYKYRQGRASDVRNDDREERAAALGDVDRNENEKAD